MNYSKKLAAIMACAALSAGAVSCSSSAKFTTVSAQTFEKGIETPGTQILDVRTPSEFESGHIAGAENIDIASPSFVSRMQETLDKQKPVYVYCRGGRRSKEAAEILVKHGYKVIDLDGGIMNWENNGLPVEK